MISSQNPQTNSRHNKDDQTKARKSSASPSATWVGSPENLAQARAQDSRSNYSLEADSAVSVPETWEEASMPGGFSSASGIQEGHKNASFEDAGAEASLGTDADRWSNENPEELREDEFHSAKTNERNSRGETEFASGEIKNRSEAFRETRDSGGPEGSQKSAGNIAKASTSQPASARDSRRSEAPSRAARNAEADVSGNSRGSRDAERN